MRKTLIAGALLGLLPLKSIAEVPAVAVDIAPLHSLVSQVMGELGSPSLIISAEASPHQYSLKPSQADALEGADLVFWMGEPYTPWLDKALHNLAQSAQHISVLETYGIVLHPFREGASFEAHDHANEHTEGHGEHEAHEDRDHHAEHGDEQADAHAHEHEEHDHGPSLWDRFVALFDAGEHAAHHEPGEEHAEVEHGHDHDAGHDAEHDPHHNHHHAHDGMDPHAWLDPQNAITWLGVIADHLAAADTDNAEIYARNAAQAQQQLKQLMQETQTRVDALGELKFIVFHDAYQYFERRFAVEASGAISLGDATAPSPARIAEIRQTVKKLGVNCVFSEPQYNPGPVKNVFDSSAVNRIGVMDPLGATVPVGPGHYGQLIEGMVSSLKVCAS